MYDGMVEEFKIGMGRWVVYFVDADRFCTCLRLFVRRIVKLAGPF